MPKRDELQDALDELQALEKTRRELNTKSSIAKKKLRALTLQRRYDRRRAIGSIVLEHLFFDDRFDAQFGDWLLQAIQEHGDPSLFDENWLDDEEEALLEVRKLRARREKRDA